jgi:hypothetical protein
MTRIALYFGDGRKISRAELRHEFRSARASGLRIVTIKRETPVSLRGGRRPVFERLVRRMGAGEFEVISAILVPETAAADLPPPRVGGHVWIGKPARPRR